MGRSQSMKRKQAAEAMRSASGVTAKHRFAHGADGSVCDGGGCSCGGSCGVRATATECSLSSSSSSAPRAPAWVRLAACVPASILSGYLFEAELLALCLTCVAVQNAYYPKFYLETRVFAHCTLPSLRASSAAHVRRVRDTSQGKAGELPLFGLLCAGLETRFAGFEVHAMADWLLLPQQQQQHQHQQQRRLRSLSFAPLSRNLSSCSPPFRDLHFDRRAAESNLESRQEEEEGAAAVVGGPALLLLSRGVAQLLAQGDAAASMGQAELASHLGSLQSLRVKSRQFGLLVFSAGLPRFTSLRELRIGTCEDIRPGMLPATLEVLDLRKYRGPLLLGMFPAGLLRLRVHAMTEYCHGVLPPRLEEFRCDHDFACWNRGCDVLPGFFPESLRVLRARLFAPLEITPDRIPCANLERLRIDSLFFDPDGASCYQKLARLRLDHYASSAGAPPALPPNVRVLNVHADTVTLLSDERLRQVRALSLWGRIHVERPMACVLPFLEKLVLPIASLKGCRLVRDMKCARLAHVDASHHDCDAGTTVVDEACFLGLLGPRTVGLKVRPRNPSARSVLARAYCLQTLEFTELHPGLHGLADVVQADMETCVFPTTLTELTLPVSYAPARLPSNLVAFARGDAAGAGAVGRARTLAANRSVVQALGRAGIDPQLACMLPAGLVKAHFF